jgi:hypothetical protein
VSQLATEGGVMGGNSQTNPADRARQLALIRYYREDNLEAARALWALQSGPPVDQNELAMVADIQATAGSPEAVSTIERLREFHAGEAEIMLAELRFAQRDYDGAAAALERAFATFHRDPWALPRFAQKGIERAQELGASNPAIARRMIEALREPFAVKVADHRRLMAVALLTSHVDFKTLCADALAAFEPNVPWAGDFLALRRDCYAETGSARLAAATRDLNEYLSMEGLPLNAGVPSTPPAASVGLDSPGSHLKTN